MKPPTPLIVHPDTLIPEAVEAQIKAKELEICRVEGAGLGKFEGQRVHFWDQAEYSSEDFKSSGLRAPEVVHALDEHLTEKLERIGDSERAIDLKAPTGGDFEGIHHEVLDWHIQHEDQWGWGQHLATIQFNPNWYALFDPAQKSKLTDLAKRCLKYLEVDTILERKGSYSYAMEAYWEFYLSEDYCEIADRVREKSPLKDAYQAHIGFILYFLGEHAKAKEYWEATELGGLEKLEHIHFYGVLSALLGNKVGYEAGIRKLPEYYFETEGLDMQKHFFEALACVALGDEDRMLGCLARAKEADEFYEYKTGLLDYVRGVVA